MQKNNLETRLQKIEARNARVELDKKWETSWTRRLLIAGIIYVVIVLFFISMYNTEYPLIAALVPPVGFLLSTLALPGARKIWEKSLKQK